MLLYTELAQRKKIPGKLHNSIVYSMQAWFGFSWYLLNMLQQQWVTDDTAQWQGSQLNSAATSPTRKAINSSPTSAAYMRQGIGSALVQIMACHLLGAKPLSNQSCVVVTWTLRNKLKWNFNQNTKLFIHKNASENIVCDHFVQGEMS